MSTGTPEAVTQRASWAMILRDSEGLEVVQVSQNEDELITWYWLEHESGRLDRFRPVPDMAARNSEQGGIWLLPAGTEVFPGWRMTTLRS